MQSLKKIHAWAQMKVPLFNLLRISSEFLIDQNRFLPICQTENHLTVTNSPRERFEMFS